MKIAIVEDISSIRNGYYKFFQSQTEVEQTRVFESAEDFLNDLENDFIPDVILMDIGLPGISGIKCIHLVKSKHPEIEIIMLTVYDDGTRIFNSLCAGATGYLLKNTPLQEIKQAVLDISKGQSPMDPSIARRVVEYFNPKKEKSQLLSDKEMDVVKALSDGLSYKLIADRFEISINTVRQHIRSIYKKLQVNSKTEVISLYSKGQI